MSRLYAGWIREYHPIMNSMITMGMIQSYSPDPEDTIIICSSPSTSDTTSDSDNINVYVEFNYFQYAWQVYVSDTSYDGDIAFQVITPETPTTPNLLGGSNTRVIGEMFFDFAVAAGPPPDIR